MLADGERAHLRCLRAADRDLLVEGFERLSPESRYYRFFSAKERLTETELRYLTDIDLVRHFALGAVRTLPDGTQQGMGLARFICLPDRDDVAEPALAVADDCHRKGLGTLLFSRLLEAAAERGVVWFECHVLGDNTGMKAVLDDASSETTWRPGDNGAMIATFRVVPTAPANLPATLVRESLAHRLLRAAAQQVIALVPGRKREPETPESQ